ncbi:MAG: alpha-L-fucosidase, partial [Clostridia bacterium]|nr:alpha-L-fucosidase [Clostridia bacterium]
MYRFDRGEYERRMQWFTHARFGMFIHWGLY